MNSRERRYDRRLWRYQVKYDVNAGQGPQSRDEYDEMWDWCAAQWGRRTNVWREKIGCVGTHWQFRNEQAYLLFVLKFGAGQ